ncbi:phosphoglycerate kinase [Patescibacteria group bacterium]
MNLKTLKNTNVDGKTILYRSPYDIGVKEVNGKLVVKDDSRIKATIPTLKYLIKKKCKIVILTWVKRPDGKVVEELRTTPHAEKLRELLGKPVQKANDCIGGEVHEKIASLKPGEILMLENTRFHPEEMVDNDEFAQELAKNGELIVHDAFPQAHRIHASTTGILRHLPACAGLYLQSEVEALTKLVENPPKPFVVIIGGAKISDKVDAINNLLTLADEILIGGGVANVFLKAKGFDMGGSFMEDVFVDKVKKEKKDWVVYAKEILEKDKKGKIKLPQDLVLGNSLENAKEVKTVGIGKSKALVGKGWAALDIGPKTSKDYKKIISGAKCVFWNGPMGLFEDERFSKGSEIVAKAMIGVKGTKVVSGGDTIEAARKFTDLNSYTHVSLAGGATLEFLAGKKLPALEPLYTNS